jgi:hypothetical protein
VLCINIPESPYKKLDSNSSHLALASLASTVCHHCTKTQAVVWPPVLVVAQEKLNNISLLIIVVYLPNHLNMRRATSCW